MIDIELELAQAIRFRDKFLRPNEMPFSRHVQWGLARVTFFGRDRRCYEPMPDGQAMAFVAPVVEGGDLIDLCAIDGRTEHTGFRMDLGRGLGIDAIADARMGADLVVLPKATAWLHRPVGTVWLRDLSTLVAALDGVAQFTCATIELAQRVQSLLPPSERERLVLDG